MSLTKALQKIKNNFSLIRALPFSSRILFINVFIVSLFSYHGLFFILPTELWKKIKNAISKVVIPFNGGAFTYDSLVCAKKIFSLKLPLKDVWAFNISLLAVRSPLFKNPTQNYFSLPTIGTNFNMHITEHRDAAAVDFWRSRHLPDGRLVPLSVPSSTEVYKVLVDDVYLDDSTDQVSKKISNYLQVYQPGLPATPPQPPHHLDQKFKPAFSCPSGPPRFPHEPGQQRSGHFPLDEAPKPPRSRLSGPLLFLRHGSGLPPPTFSV